MSGIRNLMTDENIRFLFKVNIRKAFAYLVKGKRKCRIIR